MFPENTMRAFIMLSKEYEEDILDWLKMPLNEYMT